MAHGLQMSQSEFIRRGKAKYGDAFSYSRVIYKGCNPIVKLKCKACGNWFETRARTHIRDGSLGGCKACANKSLAKLQIATAASSFVERAKAKHGRKFKYDNATYVGFYKKLKVYCRGCKSTICVSPELHLRDTHGGCKSCKVDSKSRKAQSNFLAKASEMHGKRYDYSKSTYTGIKKKLSIHCNECRRDFIQVAAQHLIGRGCPHCGGSAMRSRDHFIEKAERIHGKLYDYSKVVYTGVKKKVLIGCRECEKTFEQIPNSHYSGSGCPDCNQPQSHSKSAIRWLQHEAKKRRIKIQHAANGGEFRVPGTRYRVDGYHKRSKTIFEFHGDIYHGNPDVFKPRSRPNPYSSKTAAQLYKETMAREKILRDLGYTVVVMWQNDYRKLLRAGVI